MHALLEYWTEMFDYTDRANRKFFIQMTII
ncbi:Uncharacterised protein [Weissella viridescens]|uniref:Uncharacterized protein n=1 Tax=Weissella viridescens TaxID=1629 RepID=A0A380P3U5_WEIVI|nr:Uncharacterised protein [Weissella viridescens]